MTTRLSSIEMSSEAYVHPVISIWYFSWWFRANLFGVSPCQCVMSHPYITYSNSSIHSPDDVTYISITSTWGIVVPEPNRYQLSWCQYAAYRLKVRDRAMHFASANCRAVDHIEMYLAGSASSSSVTDPRPSDKGLSSYGGGKAIFASQRSKWVECLSTMTLQAGWKQSIDLVRIWWHLHDVLQSSKGTTVGTGKCDFFDVRGSFIAQYSW